MAHSHQLADEDSSAVDAGELERLPSRGDVAIAALLALFVAVFVWWTPITKLRTHTLGSWNHLSQLSTLTAIDPQTAPSNEMVLDPVRQMIPWALLARDELRSGRAPLWNPHDGDGIPLLANYQAAVFSPFTLPFYVLPLKLAILASAAGRTACMVLSMFLFLRALGRSRMACAIGAIVYATAIFHAMYSLHPHVAVHALLPFALLFVERITRRLERDPGVWRAADAIGLALSLGTIALAGHPESFAFALIPIAGYSAWRLGAAALHWRSDRVRQVSVVRVACVLLVAAVVGAALGAVQWLPFLEYIRNSAVGHEHARDLSPLVASYWPLLFFPNLLGSAIGGHMIGHAEPNPLIGAAYAVGPLATLLALGSLFASRAWRKSSFFVVAGLAALAYSFDVPVIGHWLSQAWLTEFLPVTYSNVIWIVGAAVGTSGLVDAALDARKRNTLLAWIAIAAAFAAVVWVARERLFRGLAEHAGAPELPMPPDVAVHVSGMIACMFAGLAALAVIVLSTHRLARTVCCVAIAAVVLLESVEPFRDYQPTDEDRFVFAARPELRELASALDGERCVFLTSTGLYPNSNMALGVDLVSSYDAIEIRELDELRAKLFGYGGYTGRTLLANRRALDLFGVRYVATSAEWLPLDTEFATGASSVPGAWYLHGELGLPRKPRFVELDAGRPSVIQHLKPSRDGFDGLVFHFSALEVGEGAVARVVVREARGSVVAQRQVELAKLARVPGDRLEVVLAFDPRADSSSKSYELEIARDAQSSGTLRLFRALAAGSNKEDADEDSTEPRANGWNITSNGRELRGRVVLDVSYGRADFTTVGQFAGLTLHRYEKFAGRAWLVPGARSVADHERAVEVVLGPAFDPRREVVLERENADASGASGENRLELLASVPTRSQYRAHCTSPAFLVSTQAFLPGWRATVGGRDAQVERGNAAFCAVALPAGDHDVVLEYVPGSFRFGALLTLAGVATVVCAAILAARRNRARFPR